MDWIVTSDRMMGDFEKPVSRIGRGHYSGGLAQSGDYEESESREALSKDPLCGAGRHLPRKGRETESRKQGRAQPLNEPTIP